MVAFTKGVPVPSIGEEEWGDELNLFLIAHAQGVINVREQPYGAVGDGVHDDTAAIQAAINAAMGGAISGTIPTPQRSGVNGGRVFLPAGIYKITSPLVIRAVQGLKFWGAGSRATFIRVVGTLTQAIQMLGANSIDVAGFTVDGNGFAGAGHVTSAITWDWTPAETAGSSYRSTFRDVWITDLDFKYGWNIGGSSGVYDVSGGQWSHCQCYGNFTPGDGTTTQWQAAYQIGSGVAGNVLNHYFNDCHQGFVKHGYYVNNVNNVSVSQGSTSDVENLFYKVGPGEIVLRDHRIEDSWRLADSLGGASYTAHFKADGVHWSQAVHSEASGRVIKWGYPGTVEIANSTFDYDAFAGLMQKIYVFTNPGNGITSVTLRNVSMYGLGGSSPAEHIEVAATTQVKAVFEGVTETAVTTGSWLISHPLSIVTFNTNNELVLGDKQATGLSGTDQTSILRLAHPGDATLGSAALAYADGTSDRWWLYKTPTSDILFLRDLINARMHATFTPGASNTAAVTELASELKLDGPLNHDGTTVGLFGHTPSAQPAAYTVTHPTTDRALDVTVDTLAQVAQVLGTLIADLQSLGVIG